MQYALTSILPQRFSGLREEGEICRLSDKKEPLPTISFTEGNCISPALSSGPVFQPSFAGLRKEASGTRM